jgi:hypothetical protein
MNVTTATHGKKEKSNMSIDSENTSTSAAEAPATKGPRKAKEPKSASYRLAAAHGARLR